MNQAKWKVVLVVLVVTFFGVAESIQAQFRAKDPGVAIIRPALSEGIDG